MSKLKYDDPLSKKIATFWNISKCWNGQSAVSDPSFTVESAIKQCDSLLEVINPYGKLSQTVNCLRSEIISYGSKKRTPAKQCK